MNNLIPFHEQVSEIERRVRDAGYTVEELCDKAGISRSTWTRWKSKSFDPRHSNVLSIMRALSDLESGEAA